ncbi:hypothetical protein CspHIS471_0704250 [Cutaneotrichosporon sp. HIS471]|nr:hypothetical protein CspHIS471_0704250 [Cutaneotrichosporon sp. HIS471]
MRGLGLTGVTKLEVDQGGGLDDTTPIDPQRASMPRSPDPEVEMVELALRPPPSPRFPPSSAVNWTPTAQPATPHWSPLLPASPTALPPPPRRRPVSTQLELMSVREPPPTQPSFTPLVLPAELDLDDVQLLRHASLPLPPRSPLLSLDASAFSHANPSLSLEHLTLARRSLPESECTLHTLHLESRPHATQCELECRLLATESGNPGLASPIRLKSRQPYSSTPLEPNEPETLLALASPIHLRETPTPSLPLEPERRRCAGLPLPALARVLALVLVPFSMWLYLWQRGTLSASASVSSLSCEEREDSSDESEAEEEEATIRAAWRESLDLSRSTSISLSTTHRNSLTVPRVGGVAMSREASWDGSAYSGALPKPSPPLVRRTEDGLLVW